MRWGRYWCGGLGVVWVGGVGDRYAWVRRWGGRRRMWVSSLGTRLFSSQGGRHPCVWGIACVFSSFLPSCIPCASSRPRGMALGRLGLSPWRIVPAHRRRGLPPPPPPPPLPLSPAATCRGMAAPRGRADLPPPPRGGGPSPLPYHGREARGGGDRCCGSAPLTGVGRTDARGGGGKTDARGGGRKTDARGGGGKTDAMGGGGAVAAAGATRRGAAWPSCDPPTTGESILPATRRRVPNRDSSPPLPPARDGGWCSQQEIVRETNRKAEKRAAVPPTPHCQWDRYTLRASLTRPSVEVPSGTGGWSPLGQASANVGVLDGVSTATSGPPSGQFARTDPPVPPSYPSMSTSATQSSGSTHPQPAGGSPGPTDGWDHLTAGDVVPRHPAGPVVLTAPTFQHLR